MKMGLKSVFGKMKFGVKIVFGKTKLGWGRLPGMK